ncbi:MAG: hypothetical protein WDA09_03920 [Bacteriovoracaceae bacterium]
MHSFVISLFIILVGPVFAEEETSDNFHLLDKTHYLLKNNLDYLANRVDSFFATERADDEFGRSTLRIRTNYELRELARGESDINYRINFKIPSLNRRIKESTDKLFPNKKDSEDSSSQSQIPTESRRDWYFNADVGVNASIPPKAVLRTRLRKNFLFEKWSHRFSEEVTYVTEEDGLTEETILTSDFSISTNLLLRITNSKEWKVLSKQFRTNHGPNLIHQVTERDALSYSLIAQSIIEEEGPWILSNYRLSTRYRRDLYRHWIYLDTITGLDFPKEYSFRRNPFVIFQLEVLFGS